MVINDQCQHICSTPYGSTPNDAGNISQQVWFSPNVGTPLAVVPTVFDALFRREYQALSYQKRMLKQHPRRPATTERHFSHPLPNSSHPPPPPPPPPSAAMAGDDDTASYPPPFADMAGDDASSSSSSAAAASYPPPFASSHVSLPSSSKPSHHFASRSQSHPARNVDVHVPFVPHPGMECRIIVISESCVCGGVGGVGKATRSGKFNVFARFCVCVCVFLWEGGFRAAVWISSSRLGAVASLDLVFVCCVMYAFAVVETRTIRRVFSVVLPEILRCRFTSSSYTHCDCSGSLSIVSVIVSGSISLLEFIDTMLN